MANSNVIAQFNELAQAGGGVENKTLKIDRSTALSCPCGCKGQAGKPGKFITGHDARLKGILILAASRGFDVETDLYTVSGEGEAATSSVETSKVPAFDVAKARGWEAMINRGVELTKQAEERKVQAAQEKADAKEKAAAEKATKAAAKADAPVDFTVGQEGIMVYKGSERTARVTDLNLADKKITVEILKKDGSAELSKEFPIDQHFKTVFKPVEAAAAAS